MKQIFFHVRHSKWISLAVKLGLTLAAFWFVFRDVDFSQLAQIVEKQNHGMLAVAALLIGGQIALGALRWRLILRALSAGAGLAMSVMQTIRLYYISVFFNCCLPGTVGGDVVRVWMTKSDHLPLTLSINSVIIDRLIALLALGLLVIATLPMLGAAVGFNAWVVWPVVLFAALAGWWSLFRIQRLLAPYEQYRAVRWLIYFTSCLLMLFKYPRASMTSLVFAVGAHVCWCMCGYVLAQSLGIALTPLQCLTLIPPVMLAITLPISIGGWGLREAGMVGMLSLAGVPQAEALLLSIQMGLINIVMSLPAGLLWLGYRDKARPENLFSANANPPNNNAL